MSTKIQRFDFGTLRDFRQPLPVMIEPPMVTEEAPPPPPVFSESELHAARESARESGYQEGFLAGEAEAKKQQDALAEQSRRTLVELAAKLADLEARYAATLARQSQHVSELALLIAKKVAGAALAQNTGAVIAELVARCLPVVMGKPRLIIELPAEALVATERQLRDYLAAQHYEGDVICRVNPGLAPHDARIDWENGHAARSTEALWQEIESLIQKLPQTITLASIDASKPHATTGENHGR